MISDEKMSHVVHLMFEYLEKEKWVEFSNRELAFRDAKKLCFQYLSRLNAAHETARNKIASQKNAPPEMSPQWDNLFRKYYEEELRKLGG